MSSIIKLLRRIGGTKATPTAGEEGQLAVWKAGRATTDATSLYFHDGNQWVELLDTSRNPRVIDANDTVPGFHIKQRGTGPALLIEDETSPDTTPFVVDKDGNVGIGMTTPEVSLDVAGRARFQTSVYIRTKLGSHSLYLREVAGENHIDSYDDSPTGTYTQTPLQMNAKTFNFKVGSHIKEQVFIDATGKVGLGVQAPTHQLEVEGDVKSKGSYILETKANVANIYLREIGGFNRIDSYNGAFSAGYPLALEAASFDFNIGPKTAFSIDAVGNLLKGTPTNFTTPYGAAEVSILAASAGVVIQHTGATGGSAPTAMVFLNSSGAPSGYISVSGTAVTYTTLSDYRLKENVTPLSDATARVKALRPVQFNFKADPANTVDGFLAHEVQAVVPEAVAGEKDNVTDDGQIIPQGLDAGKLIPILTAALQDALKRIEALEART